MKLSLSIHAYGMVCSKALLAKEETVHKVKVNYSNFLKQKEGLEEFR